MFKMPEADWNQDSLKVSLNTCDMFKYGTKAG